jgi:hypothetical protein
VNFQYRDETISTARSSHFNTSLFLFKKNDDFIEVILVDINVSYQCFLFRYDEVWWRFQYEKTHISSLFKKLPIISKITVVRSIRLTQELSETLISSLLLSETLRTESARPQDLRDATRMPAARRALTCPSLRHTLWLTPRLTRYTPASVNNPEVPLYWLLVGTTTHTCFPQMRTTGRNFTLTASGSLGTLQNLTRQKLN